MNEKLLHYIWQFQCFSKTHLYTIEGQSLRILFQGSYNHNQGPDFTAAKIRIDDTVWAGNIEIHVLSSDWEMHGHSNDAHYQNVILHVVWKHDKQLSLPFSTLELFSLVPKLLLQQYKNMLEAAHFIPCEKQLQRVNEIVLVKWKERMLIERLEDKAAIIIQLLQKCNRHWEQTCWWVLGSHFGMQVNKEVFLVILQSIPFEMLARQRMSVEHLEALLLGQAGLLSEETEDKYLQLLKKHYLFLQKKYALQQPAIRLNMLRMRPANFPGIRLAELAALMHQSAHIFSIIIQSTALNELQQKLELQASAYWNNHYSPGRNSATKPKHTGKLFQQHLLINAIIPLLYAYAIDRGEPALKSKAIQWMQELMPEHNKITRGFQMAGMRNETAFDSQAMIRLKQVYCDHKRCLECAIGVAILKQA